MFETSKRWRVPYLIYLLALIMLAEIAFNGEAPNRQPTHEDSSLFAAGGIPQIASFAHGCALYREKRTPTGYATWFVEQQRPECAPTRRLWNPQDVGRVSESSWFCARHAWLQRGHHRHWESTQQGMTASCLAPADSVLSCRPSAGRLGQSSASWSPWGSWCSTLSQTTTASTAGAQRLLSIAA